MDKKNSRPEKEELKFADFFKKAFFTGVGALFVAEETIQQMVGEAKLPQEMVKMILKNAQKGKEEVFEIVRQEFHKVIQKYDLLGEAGKFLKNHEMDIKIRFTPKEKS